MIKEIITVFAIIVIYIFIAWALLIICNYAQNCFTVFLFCSGTIILWMVALWALVKICERYKRH